MMSNLRLGMLALAALLATTPAGATAVRYAFETGPAPGGLFVHLFGSGNLAATVQGFELDGFRLVNVQLFWLETLFDALDFVPLTGGPVGFAFFDGLRVAPVVVTTLEPGSLLLLGFGLAGLGFARRCRLLLPPA